MVRALRLLGKALRMGLVLAGTVSFSVSQPHGLRSKLSLQPARAKYFGQGRSAFFQHPAHGHRPGTAARLKHPSRSSPERCRNAALGVQEEEYGADVRTGGCLEAGD